MHNMQRPCDPNTGNLLLKKSQMKSKNHRLLLILVAGLCGALLWLAYSSRPVSLGADRAAVSETSEDHQAPRVEEKKNGLAQDLSVTEDPSESAVHTRQSVGDDPVSISGIVRAAYNAADAHEHINALTELSKYDPDMARELERQLEDLCSRDAVNYDSEAVRAKRLRFCAGHAADPAAPATTKEIIDTMAESPLYRLQEETTRRLNAAKTPEDRSDLFTELVLDTAYPEQLAFLMGENVQNFEALGTPLWTLGQTMLADRYPSADLVRAQTTALYLFMCVRFGGCGANQIITIIYCRLQLTGRCAASATLEELLYQTTPPADFQLANEILGALLSYRQRRAH